MLDALPVLRGMLDVLVLKALLAKPMHGFEITNWIEQRSGGTLGIQDSALSQALRRMEERGLIVAEWGVTEKGQRACYYTVSRDRRKHLASAAEQWVRYADVVTGILTSPSKPA